MLVEIYGLKLALPLEYIEGTQHINMLTLQLDNLHDWILGSFGSPLSLTQIVDTAGFLIPDRYDATKSHYKEVVVLTGRRWAISCDELVKSIKVPSARININTDKKSRPWLLGTYMPERCAIVDIPELLEQLERAFQ